MSFWNDPANNQVKVLLLIGIVAIGGWAVYNFAGNPDSNLQGSAFQGTKKIPPATVDIKVTFGVNTSCTITACAPNIASKGTTSCIDYQGTTILKKGVSYCSKSDGTTGVETTNNITNN